MWSFCQTFSESASAAAMCDFEDRFSSARIEKRVGAMMKELEVKVLYTGSKHN
jgi:hypothetical protein